MNATASPVSAELTIRSFQQRGPNERVLDGVPPAPPVPTRPDKMHPRWIPSSYARLKQATDPAEILACLTELADEPEKDHSDPAAPDWLGEALGFLLSQPRPELVIARIIAAIDTKFVLRTASRVFRNPRYKPWPPAPPEAVNDRADLDDYFRARAACEQSLKLIAVLTRLGESRP